MKYVSAVVLVLGVLFGCLPAFAQEEEVRELNAQGLRAFSQGDYVQAAQLFGRAYALEPESELLKNQAVAWYKAERCSEAVESAHQFLMRDDVKTPERGEIQSLIGACKVKLAQEAMEARSYNLAEKLLNDVDAMAPDPVLADRVSRVRVELAQRRANDPSNKAAVPSLDGVAAPDKKPGGSPDRTNEVRLEDIDYQEEEESSGSGWPLVGMGSFILAGALVYHITMAAVVEPDFIEAASEGTDKSRYDRLDRSLRVANVLVPTLYGLGGAVTATGIVLVLSSPPSPKTGKEGLVMVGVSGRF